MPQLLTSFLNKNNNRLITTDKCNPFHMLKYKPGVVSHVIHPKHRRLSSYSVHIVEVEIINSGEKMQMGQRVKINKMNVF